MASLITASVFSEKASQCSIAILVSGMPRNPQLENIAPKDAAARFAPSLPLIVINFIATYPIRCTISDSSRHITTFCHDTSDISTSIIQ